MQAHVQYIHIHTHTETHTHTHMFVDLNLIGSLITEEGIYQIEFMTKQEFSSLNNNRYKGYTHLLTPH